MNQFSRVPDHIERIAKECVDSGLRVHMALGPGLLESTYEKCLVLHLRKKGLRVESQVMVPIQFEGETIEDAFRLDLLVEKELILEVKAIEEVKSIHRAQLLTYLRLCDKRLGILMNFKVTLFKDGVERIING